MNPAFDAFLRSWPFNPLLILSLALTAAVYFRGWRPLRCRIPERWSSGRLVAFLAGLSAIFLALGSPIELFSSMSLSIHMVQHLLLLMVAPPLIWLGAPSLALLGGLPRPVRLNWIGPVLRARRVQMLARYLSHPLAALPLFVAAVWVWHAPLPYDWALQSDACHYLEHVSFLAAGLLFWFPVIRPEPSRPRWSLWLLIPYLILADVQNTLLSALLTFANRPIYRYYIEMPSLPGLSPLRDQAAAGVIMWVPGSIAFLIPLFVIGVQLLLPTRADRQRRSVTPKHEFGRIGRQLPVLQEHGDSHRFDLLRAPFLGHFLRWRHARLTLQLPLAILAGALIVDGLRGPQIAAINLAGVLPWIHWRGLLILALLVVGNFFCMACPFTLPRRLAGRWLGAGRRWPAWLRTKWLAIGLVALFLWAYETFALWNSPRWTAWIAIGYFVTAFAIDGLFPAGTFCKYVCPIGQFNFVQSLVSPLEVHVRSRDICASCTTHDCIRGGESVPGCQARLFQPHKSSNMDCTFCLDCVHACPHENVGLLAGIPGKELWSDSFRSGIGRFARRPDLAALVVILVFGSLSNAAGMVAPVLEWEEGLRLKMGGLSPWILTTLFAGLSLIALPATTLGPAAILSRRWGRLAATRIEVATRFSYALLPLGFAMWLSHYSFHFLTSWETVLPASQRVLQDLGWTFFGEPRYRCACCRPVGDWLLKLEVLSLDVGLLMSLYAGYRIALGQSAHFSRAIAAFLPWGVLTVLLFAGAIWIVFQPMQMRGTLPGSG
jgi:cytochrome c oxidase assembly factor CtaG/polyferredoxin